MSIHFMTERHSFIRLDDKPIEEAINAIKEYINDEPTYGFVGCSGNHGEEVYQWRPEDDWEPKVREMLKSSKPL